MKDKKSQKKKRINVSAKRQITIPKHFYDKLGMEKEIICELRENEIILRHVSHTEDNSEAILEHLVNQGFKGDELLREFQKQKTQNQPEAVKKPGISAKNQTGKVDEQIKIILGNSNKR